MIGKKRILKIKLGLLNSLILTGLLVLFGCASASYSTYDYEYPIMDIQSVVAQKLPEGLGFVNTNRRIFYSKKFTVKESNKNIPLVMRIIIQGDRRPYGLDVTVRRVSPRIPHIEEAFENGRDFRGQESLAKRVVKEIETELVQRRKNKNVIDDFRAF